MICDSCGGTVGERFCAKCGASFVDYEHDPRSEYRRGVPATPIYGNLIREATGCGEDEAGGVERFMRDTYGTLDGLSREKFFDEASHALELLHALWEENRR